MSVYDHPWKSALERYFEPFTALCFPEIHAGIDWSAGIEFLDHELQQVLRKSETTDRNADRLVSVRRLDGDQAWVLVHIEVQNEPEPEFAERMYVYNYRLFDRYRRNVCSVAVLTDASKRWRPGAYERDLWGSRARLEFPYRKLLDYNEQWEALAASENPVAVILRAHLKTHETAREPEARLGWKIGLARELYDKGFSREDVLELYRFLDWVMTLPEELEQNFIENIRDYEREKQMPFVTHIERAAREEGEAQGIERSSREAIVDIVEAQFGAVAPGLLAALERIDDADTLRDLRRLALRAADAAEVLAAAEAAAPDAR
jgi:hypothetical protein